MSSSSFSLLQLPLVALREVIEKIELYEQYNLSQCSKRMYYVVKYYRHKLPMSLKMFSVRENFVICFLMERSSENKVTLKFKVDVEGDPNSWNSRETIQRTKFLVEYICDLFTTSVKKVFVRNGNISMLYFIEGRQGAFSYDAVVWNINDGTDEKVRHFLLDLNPRSLDFYHKVSEQFRIENFHKKYANLTISEASWVTVENLCQLDCVTLCINDRYFSNTEVNRYLKHVLRGGAPRLRRFEAAVCHAEENVILDGIRELLTGMKQRDDQYGNWNVTGTVAREEGSMEVSIMHLFTDIFLEINET